MSKPQKPHRITIYKVDGGGWRYRVQSKNWRVIEAPNVTADKAESLERIVTRRYPGVEVVTE